MNCFQNLVGITPDACECLPEAPEGVDLHASISGLYLANLVGECMVLKNDCSSDVWGVMTSALDDAHKVVTGSVLSQLGNKIQNRYTPFSGILGEGAYAGIKVVSGNATLTLKTKQIDGMTLVLRKIGVMVNQAVSGLLVTVRKDGTAIKAYTLSVTAYSDRLYPTSPLILPLDGSTYTFSYDVGGEFMPLNNNLSCGCGGKDSIINQFFTPNITGPAFGFRLDMESRCDSSEVVCDMMNDAVYKTAIAYMVQYKAAELVMQRILAKGQNALKTYQAFGLEAINQRMSAWKAEYDTYVNWIRSNANLRNLPENRCYKCGSNNYAVGGLKL